MILLSSGGCNIEGEEESWDFGTGAGFYVNATQEPWKNNYRMYSYVTEEVFTLALFYTLMTVTIKDWIMHSSSSLHFFCSQLPRLINSNFPADPEKMSISGHSMGGHGALVCALKNPGKYKAYFILFALLHHLVI